LLSHRKAINAVAAHPSARVALSVGRDKSFRLIDLTKGKVIAVKETEAEPKDVLYSKGGESFAILFDTSAVVYNASTAEPTSQIALPDGTLKFTSFGFVQISGKERIALGGEGGALLISELDGTAAALLATGHAGRVRCIKASQNAGIVATVGADAVVLVWRAEDLLSPSAVPLHRLQSASGLRGTCLALVDDPRSSAPVGGRSRPTPAAAAHASDNAARLDTDSEGAASRHGPDGEKLKKKQARREAASGGPPHPATGSGPASILPPSAVKQLATAQPPPPAAAAAESGKRKRKVAFAVPS
jgi:hypothetical protein